MNGVEIKNLKKSYGELNILNGIDLSVNAGEFLVLVGPSGCGKSTLLRAIAGLDLPSSGEIFFDAKNITKMQPQDRNMAMVFQNYALYPHMSVYENMAFSLEIKKMDKAEIKNRIDKIATLLQITHLLDRKPKELSGGQRQRVSLGRALAKQSPVILFDEPLSNLDAHLRQQMRIEIKNLHNIFKSTIIYVTHDQTEAMTMGDRIAVLNKGKIVQIDTPINIYQNPKNDFVAKFIGTPEINILDKSFLEQSVLSKLSEKTAQVGIRPEDIKISLEDTALKAKIEFIENLGSQLLYYVKINDQSLRVLKSSNNLYKVGDTINLLLNVENIICFDINGESL